MNQILSINKLSQIARLACFLLLSGTVSATTILGMDIDAVAQGAELVFEGQVIQHDTRENSRGLVVTYVTFQVNDVVKGNYPEPYLELKFTGGNLGGQIMEVSGLKIPEVDEQGIYFVESMSRDLINPLLGWSQGHFLIVDDNGNRRVSTLDSRPVTEVQSVQQIPPSIRKPQTLIDGDADAATGVVTEVSPLMIERALSVDEFKLRIRSLIEN